MTSAGAHAILTVEPVVPALNGGFNMAEFSLLRRKKLILRFTPVSIALEALAFLALAAGFIIMDMLYPELPKTVPTAFSADGSVLATGLKEVTLIHPILATFVFIILLCINIIARQSCPPDRPLPVLSIVLNALPVAKMLFMVYEAGRSWYAMSLLPAPAWTAYVLIGAEAVVIAVTFILIRRVRQLTKTAGAEE